MVNNELINELHILISKLSDEQIGEFIARFRQELNEEHESLNEFYRHQDF